VTIMIEPRTDYWVAAALARALPAATLTDGSRLFEELRVVKSDQELARMRRATAITEDAFAATFEQLEVGMSEQQVARLVREEHARRGVEGGALVQFGAHAALPHGGPTAATLADGMVVLIDGGCTVQGWHSDITRTRWFGRAGPPEKLRAVYNLVHDAQTAAIARVRPGVPAQAIDRAARAVIAAAGLGPRFTHRLGHGLVAIHADAVAARAAPVISRRAPTGQSRGRRRSSGCRNQTGQPRLMPPGPPKPASSVM
jgi:Xaa-Pro dipeptidase